MFEHVLPWRSIHVVAICTASFTEPPLFLLLARSSLGYDVLWLPPQFSACQHPVNFALGLLHAFTYIFLFYVMASVQRAELRMDYSASVCPSVRLLGIAQGHRSCIMPSEISEKKRVIYVLSARRTQTDHETSIVFFLKFLKQHDTMSCVNCMISMPPGKNHQ